MPQGTWLGPLSFVVLINDLLVSCPSDKYVDDTTLSELLITHPPSSSMSQYIQQLLQWSANNFMAVNRSKTKEMLLEPISSYPPDHLSIDGIQIERVLSFKLLGVHVSSDMRWDAHIDSICSKVNSKLYFLKQLKRAGLLAHDLRKFYITAIRPVLEYACVVWHHGITQRHTDRLEALQKRAIRIIFPPTFGMPYTNALFYSDLQSLYDRRVELSKKFFDKICQPDSCLNNLLPPKRDPEVLAKLRHAHTYPIPLIRTDKYCSFINYALAHFQH